ncbi:hypothetical protein IQ255_12140 [Pleurocapsales cyanobacterium LEGE 10410]|nr:hypothetical protein [Pleurocapsales cyanobacterium LEGE 10410]
MIDPDYPNVILAFVYQDFEIKISRDRWQGQNIYTAWVDYSLGSAVAVPCAVTTKLAIRNAKRWVDQRIVDQRIVDQRIQDIT